MERLAFNPGRGRSEGDVSPLDTGKVAIAAADAPAFVPASVEKPSTAFWGLLAFTAFLFFRPQDTFPVLAPLHLPELTAIVALTALFTNRLNRNLALVRLSREALGVLFLAAVMLATAPFSVWPGGALGTFTEIYFKVVVVFVLIVNCVRSVRTLRLLSWLILSAMGYLAFRGVIDYMTGHHLIKGDRLAGSISGMAGNPNDLATNMITFLPLAVTIAITKGRTVPRMTAAVFALLMLATIVFTKSRAGMLGLAAAGIVLVLQGRKLRKGLGVAVVLGGLAVAPLMPSWFWTRLSSIADSSQDATGSREARRELMEEGWHTFIEHPLTGVGAGQFRNYNPGDRLQPWHETHNVLLQVASEMGILGLAGMLMLVGFATATLLWCRRIFLIGDRGSRSPPATVAAKRLFTDDEWHWMRIHSVAMSASFVGWFVCAQFASVAYYWTFYYLFAMIVAARELTADRLAAAERPAQAAPRRLAWQEPVRV
jgi:O-antigen ligase